MMESCHDYVLSWWRDRIATQGAEPNVPALAEELSAHLGTLEHFWERYGEERGREWLRMDGGAIYRQLRQNALRDAYQRQLTAATHETRTKITPLYPAQQEVDDGIAIPPPILLEQTASTPPATDLGSWRYYTFDLGGTRRKALPDMTEADMRLALARLQAQARGMQAKIAFTERVLQVVADTGATVGQVLTRAGIDRAADESGYLWLHRQSIPGAILEEIDGDDLSEDELDELAMAAG